MKSALVWREIGNTVGHTVTLAGMTAAVLQSIAEEAVTVELFPGAVDMLGISKEHPVSEKYKCLYISMENTNATYRHH